MSDSQCPFPDYEFIETGEKELLRVDLNSHCGEYLRRRQGRLRTAKEGF